MESYQAYIQTGSNMGDRLRHLELAVTCIGEIPCEISRISSIYETAPWGLSDQPPFLNQVLHIETSLDAPKLMEALLQIETQLGRKREIKMGPRTIDLDILFFEDQILNLEWLQIPHPHIATRRFVLEPLCELNPDLLHPVYKQTAWELLNHCSDPLSVKKMIPAMKNNPV